MKEKLCFHCRGLKNPISPCANAYTKICGVYPESEKHKDVPVKIDVDTDKNVFIIDDKQYKDEEMMDFCKSIKEIFK